MYTFSSYLIENCLNQKYRLVNVVHGNSKDIFAVYYKHFTEHVNALCKQNADFFMPNLAVQILTTTP